MALSLDYIGKFIVVMVTISVATTLIISFKSDIASFFPSIPGQDSSETGAEAVRINGYVEEAVELVNLCHQKSLERSHESFTCFIATVESGSIEFTPGNLRNKLDDYNFNSHVDDNTISQGTPTSQGTSTLIIRYSASDNEIKIEGVD